MEDIQNSKTHKQPAQKIVIVLPFTTINAMVALFIFARRNITIAQVHLVAFLRRLFKVKYLIHIEHNKIKKLNPVHRTLKHKLTFHFQISKRLKNHTVHHINHLPVLE